MPPDLALLSTLIGSKYPCLELICMVPKVLESLKFDCMYFQYLSIELFCVTLLLVVCCRYVGIIRMLLLIKEQGRIL